MKNERMISIEKTLGWTEQEIRDALAMLHDSNYAENNKDSESFKATYDKSIQALCFEYLDNLYKIKETK